MTATEAPAETSGTTANCAAPAATNTDIPSVSRAKIPLPAAVAPKASPNGSRANKTGTIALAPDERTPPRGMPSLVDGCP